MVALADSLEVMSVMSLTYQPDVARHQAQLQQANRKAYDAYEILKEAAAAYIEAQFEAVFAAREAHDNGITLTELDTSWLRVAAEQAVIEARMEISREDAQAQQIDDEVGKAWTHCAPPATSHPSASKTSKSAAALTTPLRPDSRTAGQRPRHLDTRVPIRGNGPLRAPSRAGGDTVR